METKNKPSRRTKNLTVSPFSQRFRYDLPGSGWTKSKQVGPMNTNVQQASAVPRCFAEFPYNVLCQEVGMHIRQLHGATFKGFLGNGETTCLRFGLQGHDFTVEERNGRLLLMAENPRCPEPLLHQVQAHFAALLTPHLSE
jgi:hypothetical protein